MLPKKYRLVMKGLAPNFWRSGRWVRGDIIDMISMANVLAKSFAFRRASKWPRQRSGRQMSPATTGQANGNGKTGRRRPKEVSQFGFIAGRKVSHKAVIRNRGKRLMREAVRSYLPKIKPGYMVVFVAKKEIAGKSLAEVKKTVESLLALVDNLVLSCT